MKVSEVMTKDVRLYLESAEAAGVPRSLASSVVELWQRFLAADPSSDTSAIHRYLAGGGE